MLLLLHYAAAWWPICCNKRQNGGEAPPHQNFISFWPLLIFTQNYSYGQNYDTLQFLHILNCYITFNIYDVKCRNRKNFFYFRHCDKSFQGNSGRKIVKTQRKHFLTITSSSSSSKSLTLTKFPLKSSSSEVRPLVIGCRNPPTHQLEQAALYCNCTMQQI